MPIVRICWPVKGTPAAPQADLRDVSLEHALHGQVQQTYPIATHASLIIIPGAFSSVWLVGTRTFCPVPLHRVTGSRALIESDITYVEQFSNPGYARPEFKISHYS